MSGSTSPISFTLSRSLSPSSSDMSLSSGSILPNSSHPSLQSVDLRSTGSSSTLSPSHRQENDTASVDSNDTNYQYCGCLALPKCIVDFFEAICTWVSACLSFISCKSREETTPDPLSRATTPDSRPHTPLTQSQIQTVPFGQLDHILEAQRKVHDEKLTQLGKGFEKITTKWKKDAATHSFPAKAMVYVDIEEARGTVGWHATGNTYQRNNLPGLSHQLETLLSAIGSMRVPRSRTVFIFRISLSKAADGAPCPTEIIL